MLGRRTHGLAMAPLYLEEIRKGNLQVAGEPEVVRDTGATVVWDGGYLPGLWLVDRAIELALPRAAERGVVTVAIRKCHHIGCLAALVKQAADKGYVALIANSDPSVARAAPYGGTEAIFTPNPFAIGYPGADHPVLVDISASITTTSMTRQKYAAGEQFEHPVAARRAGRADARSGGARARAARLAAAARRAGVRPQGLRPRADGRGAVAGPVGLRPAGRAQALGRQRVPAGAGSRALRRPGRVRAPDEPSLGSLPGEPADPRRTGRSACLATTPRAASPRPGRTASATTRRRGARSPAGPSD